MDKFGVHLALSRHSVAQYYRQFKCWLMDQYPQQCSQVERHLLKQGRTLEQHCIKRDRGEFTKKASPCTKDDLKKMTMYLYTTASTSTDYQNAGLLCLLWYWVSRASDLTYVRMQQLSISAGKVFFIRFIRVKTSEEQELALFPDNDYTTCPLLALGHLPDEVKNVPLEVPAFVPLLELLDDPQMPPTMPCAATSFFPKPSHASSAIGIHDQVNRLLDRHANGASELSAQWIFDRGTRILTTTNKAFAYVFNTPKEDHQVAKS
ncbi:Hypothetical protein PHPALM_13305 [Phytophthora palmivora]|uniref:Uncharacterized protein n=1 Tax=Phytophthora palmivora TaxID=4796 RepID=A0A2P4XXT5_9STRA|nr:Hypothetical protein PHPALM_13305 [Phytophthora palmivora]